MCDRGPSEGAEDARDWRVGLQIDMIDGQNVALCGVHTEGQRIVARYGKVIVIEDSLAGEEGQFLGSYERGEKQGEKSG